MWKDSLSSIFSFCLFAPIALAQAAPPAEASSCARNLLSSAPSIFGDNGGGRKCIEVHSDFRDQLGPLGMHIYRIDSCLSEPKGIAWFFASGESCALLSGNIPLLIGEELPLSIAENFAISEMNRLLFQFPEIRPRISDPVAYVFAFIEVTRPYYSLRLIKQVQDIPNSHEAARRDKKILKKLSALFAPPQVISSTEVTLVKFSIWSDPGGVLEKCEILVWPDGRISFHSDLLASGVGAFSSQVFIPRTPKSM